MEAENELEVASNLTPGAWVPHCRSVGINARLIAQRVPGMDSEKAYL